MSQSALGVASCVTLDWRYLTSPRIPFGGIWQVAFALLHEFIYNRIQIVKLIRSLPSDSREASGSVAVGRDQ